MAVELPRTPAPRGLVFRPITRRRDLEPAFGGPTSRVRRLGSKWAVDVELPPMRYEKAMAWVAALTSADADTVVLALHQPGFKPGVPGSPLVNGAGQLGSLISLDTFTPEYAATAGQWFNLTAAGRTYLYQVAADTIATGGACPALPINPMIRRSPANNSPAVFSDPVIEGFISGRETTWTVDVAKTVGLAFTITERE